MIREKTQKHIIRMSVIVLDRIMNDGSPLSVSLIKLARQTYGLLYILSKLTFHAQIHTHTQKNTAIQRIQCVQLDFVCTIL